MAQEKLQRVVIKLKLFKDRWTTYYGSWLNASECQLMVEKLSEVCEKNWGNERFSISLQSSEDIEE